jgi:nicotinamide phosphoribosyltransferase
MLNNLLLLTDSYKVSHHVQYPPGTEYLYSYWESRGGLYPETVFFGLQYFLEKYVARQITKADIDYAEARFKKHFGSDAVFNREGWLGILYNHNGHLPLRIRAVPEGTVVPTRNVMLTVENTDPAVPWLTNYMETLLCQLWYPTTVATISREIKKLIGRYLEETGDLNGLPFKLHDFGFRGVSSVESAALGGAAHLVNFMGTDTMAALELAYDVYDEEMAGFSIPAAEHSTITSWGRENEYEAFRNMIRHFGGQGTEGGGLYAVVSDSYNIFNACKAWGGELLQEVRDAPNMLVVRPDSGTPHVVVVQVVETLDEGFGHVVNDKGYKVLNGVRVIQGDGVNPDEIGRILEALKVRGWSADNIAFGMGGALLQKLNRDTQRFAFKAAHIRGTYGERDVYKEPVTDQDKRSKRGRMRLVRNDNGTLETVPANHWISKPDVLRTVYEDGHILVTDTLAQVRDRAAVKSFTTHTF